MFFGQLFIYLLFIIMSFILFLGNLNYLLNRFDYLEYVRYVAHVEMAVYNVEYLLD